jgi:hypothetical protein
MIITSKNNIHQDQSTNRHLWNAYRNCYYDWNNVFEYCLTYSVGLHTEYDNSLHFQSMENLDFEDYCKNDMYVKGYVITKLNETNVETRHLNAEYTTNSAPVRGNLMKTTERGITVNFRQFSCITGSAFIKRGKSY